MGSLLSDQSKIGGQGEFVEIDESMLYRRKYNVGRILGSGWLFGGIQRSDKSKVFLAMVPDRTAETLLDVIQQRILPGTTIVSDCWRSYFHIGSFGYTHLTVNHSVNFVDPLVPEAHTQNIECTWRWVKNGFYLPQRISKRESPDYGNLYIGEFTRMNCSRRYYLISLKQNIHNL